MTEWRIEEADAIMRRSIEGVPSAGDYSKLKMLNLKLCKLEERWGEGGAFAFIARHYFS